MENNSYAWTDNPTVSGVSKCDTDVLNECLMHLKYDSQSGSGYSMFDIIQSDRILSYEESKGKALLGTWVYKKGAAGSRHGYPDFYAQCLKEMDEGVITPVKANVTQSGITFDEDFSFAVSGRNYASPGVIPLGTASSWEILIKAKTPSNWSSAIALTGDSNGVNYQYPEWRTDASGKIILFLSSNGTSWNIAESAVSPAALESNKDYWFKLEFTGNQYIASHTTDEIITENTLWSNDVIITSTTKIYTSSSLMAIGNHIYSSSNQYPWTGKIDLKNCRIKIGGEEYWRGTFNVSKHTNMHMFCSADEKYILDKMYETSGSAWYYCVDKENERIFLPRNDWFFQSGSSVDVNKFVEAGLPNITGTVKSGANGGDYMGGAFYYLNSNTAGVSGRHDGGSDANYSAGTAGFSASRSSGVYGKSSTVQPNSVKQLFYMIVGNTETQSSLIDVVDITTSENDTLPLYHNFYSTEDMTTTGVFVDASKGLYLNGNLYTTAYNDLVNKIGHNFCAGVIKEYGDSTITDYDCVVNQTDMTFKLPLLNGSENLPGDKYEDLTFKDYKTYKAEYNGIFCCRAYVNNQTGSYISYIESSYGGRFSMTGYSCFYGGAIIPVTKGQSIIVHKEANVSITQFRFVHAKGNGSLYFKLSNALQNQQVIDCAEVLNELKQKTNPSQAAHASMPSDRYIDLTVGASGTKYTAPADGYANLSKSSEAGISYFFLNNSTTKIAISEHLPAVGCNGSIWIPVSKDDIFTISYNGTAPSSLKFIYAKGAQ